jgi:hypothetical protein
MLKGSLIATHPLGMAARVIVHFPNPGRLAMLASIRAPRALALFALLTAAAIASIGAAPRAHAQSGYYASIAYSQKTGRIGFSARQARTKSAADSLAIRMCSAPDAKVFIWGRDEWVAVAVIDGHIGTAGFGRGKSSDEAQQKALEETAKRAHGNAYQVKLCVHSGGNRLSEAALRKVAAAPKKSSTGFFAALAFSPSTGKIGKTAGKATTIIEAQKLAMADCDAPDAKVFMWGDKWIAVATSPETPGIAGFGPGATREAAEKAALEQCTKYAKGKPVKIALTIYSTGEENPQETPVVQPAAAVTPAPGATPAPPAVPTSR